MRTLDVEKALKELALRETDLKLALEAVGDAEHAYKLKKAQIFLSSEGTEKARDAESVVGSEALFLDYLKKKAAAEFTKEKLRDVQQALSARQSLLKFVEGSDTLHSQLGT